MALFSGNVPDPNKDAYGYKGRGTYGTDGDSAQERRADAANYNQAYEDTQRGLGSRNAEQDAMQRLQMQADGTAPSAAELQQQMGISDSIMTQSALANSARGGPAAFATAQRAASEAGVGIRQNVIQSTMVNRAQEQERGRMALMQGAGQMRQGDQGDRRMSVQQSQFDAQLQAGQRAQNDQYGLGLYGLEQGASRAQQQGKQQYEQDKMNVASENAKSTREDMKMAISAGASGAAALSDERMKYNIQEEGLLSAGAPYDYKRLSYLGLAQQASRNSLSDERMKMDFDPVGVSPGTQSALNRDGAHDELRQQVGPIGSGNIAPGVQSALDRDAGMSPYANKTASSDMLDKLTPYSYTYKPESGEDGRKRYGIMAQDLEQSQMGASLVRDTPRGKEIDVPAATGATLAGMSDLHKRIGELESKNYAPGVQSALDRDAGGVGEKKKKDALQVFADELQKRLGQTEEPSRMAYGTRNAMKRGY